MKNIYHIIFTSLFISLTFLTPIRPVIIGASHWKWGEKNIYIYHDQHVLYNDEEQFEYLMKKVSQREQKLNKNKLTLLIETNIDDKRTHSLFKHTYEDTRYKKHDKYAGLLLRKFTPLIESNQNPYHKNKTSIKCIEKRQLLSLLYLYYNELTCRKILFNSPPIDDQEKIQNLITSILLSDETLAKYSNFLDKLTINDIQKQGDKDFKAYLEKNLSDEIQTIITRYKETFNTLSEQPIIQLSHKIPIIKIYMSIPNRNTFENLHSIFLELCTPLMEANIFFAIDKTPGDVALFTGSMHAENVEKHLTEIAKKINEEKTCVKIRYKTNKTPWSISETEYLNMWPKVFDWL